MKESIVNDKDNNSQNSINNKIESNSKKKIFWNVKMI